MKTKILFLLSFLAFMSLASGQGLKEGSVIVMNTYTFNLNQNVTMDQWMNFYKTRYIPEMEKAYPGVKEYIVWGDRGEKKDQFGTVMVFESQAVRDKYYPQEDAETPSEAAAAAEEKLKTVYEEAAKYVQPGGKRVYTDWIVK
jgi:hypothetical protein